ncbi:MAG TPA: adenylate/guanylate cyclase domain-containing protein [Candidatus Cybelea sp.]|nr:adenylate/guanylate cyclase domain-containing protein [Candidatus Cybelea sp.]
MANERPNRRLAAILAADVAGYSRLTGGDEEGTLARLRAIRKELIDPAIAAHRGRLVNTTGDGALVEFASVVDAVRCAIEVQRGMLTRNVGFPPDRQIQFRVGINLGDVVVEADDDLMGDGVNVAARLEAVASPGGICVSDDAYRQVRDKLDYGFEDLGELQLKNIARRVHAYRVRLDGSGAAGHAPIAKAIAVALPDKPSLAVLPFENMGDAVADVYFADGIAEDIITELSRYPDLFVIARNSSFTYRGKAVRATDVARELGVQYVVEGSVRRASNRVRITAQLIDARSDSHLWAQRYDRSLEDVFAVQDEVTANIVAVLPGRVEAAALERASRKTSNSLEAYDYLLRGKFCHHLENAEANREAEAHFDQSIKLDSRFASAWAWKACTLGQAWNAEFRPRTPELFQQINQFVETAAGLDENDTECHRIMCRLALSQGHYAKSEHHLDRALALNPNDPRLIVQRGINLTFLGDPEVAIAWIERAMRIDPFSASRYYLDLVRALFTAGRPAEAITVLERNAREHHEHYLWLAACHAAAGNEAAGHEVMRKAIALRPDVSIGAVFGRWPPWKRAEDKIRLRDALVLTGLPS